MIDIRDVKPPLELPGNMVMIVLLVCIVLLIVFSVCFLMLRKKNKPHEVLLPEDPRSPRERALDSLNKLYGSVDFMSGNFYLVYEQLSSIVRYFLEEEYLIKAPEMTTEEFLAYLRDSQVIETTRKGALKEFLGFCDMVKFAKYQPSREESEKSLSLARGIVTGSESIS